jgi:lysophospholipase L1-like esterase
LAETHLADVVVVDVATSNLYNMPNVPANATMAQIIAAEPSWTKQLTESLHGADQILRKNGMSLVVVTTPLPDNVSPVESLWNRLLAPDGQQAASYQIGEAMNRAVQQSGVRFVNGFSVFEAESRSPQHAALFGTQDIHFSPHGRAVLADAIAAYLERTKPWQP